MSSVNEERAWLDMISLVLGFMQIMDF